MKRVKGTDPTSSRSGTRSVGGGKVATPERTVCRSVCTVNRQEVLLN